MLLECSLIPIISSRDVSGDPSGTEGVEESLSRGQVMRNDGVVGMNSPPVPRAHYFYLYSIMYIYLVCILINAIKTDMITCSTIDIQHAPSTNLDVAG